LRAAELAQVQILQEIKKHEKAKNLMVYVTIKYRASLPKLLNKAFFFCCCTYLIIAPHLCHNMSICLLLK
jgi:hypothetical protein